MIKQKVFLISFYRQKGQENGFYWKYIKYYVAKKKTDKKLTSDPYLEICNSIVCDDDNLLPNTNLKLIQSLNSEI